MATLPPGAVRVKTEPAGLTGPALGTPGTSQLIDSVSYFSVPMPPSQAYAWFEGHPPHGFTQSGSASGGGAAGSSTYGFEYDPVTPTHRSWGSASLEIGMTAQGSTKAIRVDGLARWIDPSPVRDPSKGPALRLTVAGGCPATDRGFTDISNPGAADLDHELLPAAQFRAEPLGSRGLGPRSCPMDDGRVSILVFSYPGRADVDLWDHTSGCASTDNGHIVAGLL